MDMSGMSMDMGTNLFQTTNMALARDFWYIIAGVLGAMGLARLVNFYTAQRRLRRAASSSVEFPTKVEGRFSSTWATLKAIVRETSYPQLYVPGRWFSWLTPPPMGRILVLLVYWAIVIYMMAWDAVVFDAYFWERIGFRNAWVTVTQIPLMYLLASKCSVLGLVAGTSYERFNWLHRWVGRTMFVTATVHGWHFYQEWAKADFVQLEIQAMPMVKWGFGAWGLLLFTLLASLWPFRRLSYEVFVAQHVVTTVLFLWVVYMHVPGYAQYNVWFAVAALCFDRFYRTVMLVWQNVKVLPNRAKCMGGQRLGHLAELRAVGDDVTVVTVKDVHFRWRPGQHVYLNVPRLGPTETHPYTISCAHQVADDTDKCPCNSIQLVVRKHGGFSARLHAFAARAQHRDQGGRPTASVTAFLTGPYGEPPRFDVYETLVLIAASTGASFTLPVLEAALLPPKRSNCTRRVFFLLTAKKAEDVEFYVTRLQDLVERARDTSVDLYVHVHTTAAGPSSSSAHAAKRVSDGSLLSQPMVSPTVSAASSGGSLRTEVGEKATAVGIERRAAGAVRRGFSNNNVVPSVTKIQYASVRPDIESFIRGPVEMTGGETCVVVCGGASLVARTRNCVAGLADERAVHKGTGAQGIGLHVEEYCF